MATVTKTKPVSASKAKPVSATKAVSVKADPKTVSMEAVVKKPAAKPAPATKVEAKAEVAAKPAGKSVVKEAIKSLFVLVDIARPQSGPRLFAHTVAAMTVLGMFGKGRPAVRRAALQAFIGATAISYHTKKKGTLVEEGDKIRLTEFGVGFFPSRGFDKAEAEGFETLFRTGDGTNVKVRQQHIVPAALAL